MIFDVPTPAIDGITGYIGDLISGCGPFIWLAIGIPLAFYVIHRVMGLIPKG